MVQLLRRPVYSQGKNNKERSISRNSSIRIKHLTPDSGFEGKRSGPSELKDEVKPLLACQCTRLQNKKLSIDVKNSSDHCSMCEWRISRDIEIESGMKRCTCNKLTEPVTATPIKVSGSCNFDDFECAQSPRLEPKHDRLSAAKK